MVAIVRAMASVCLAGGKAFEQWGAPGCRARERSGGPGWTPLRAGRTGAGAQSSWVLQGGGQSSPREWPWSVSEVLRTASPGGGAGLRRGVGGTGNGGVGCQDLGLTRRGRGGLGD